MNIKIKKDSPEAAIGLLMSVAYIDNDYAEEEELLILKLAASYDYPTNEIEKIKSDIINSNYNKFDICEKYIMSIENKELKEKLFEDIGHLIASDHLLHENEIFVYKQIAQKWDMYQSSKG